MTVYLRNATYVDWRSLEFKRTHLAVSPAKDCPFRFLESVPPEAGLADDDVIVDCNYNLVTKSFACGHHHIYSALARGMPPPEKVLENFQDILESIWWRLDKSLDAETIEASALVSALYCAKNGVTLVIDHHVSPYAVESSLETIAKAFDRIGISHLLCYELSDRDGEGPKQTGLEETENYLKAGNQWHVGIHASFTVGDDLLKRAVSLAEKYGTGVHVHVAEDMVDQDCCLRDHGKRVVERYQDAGVLNLPKSILAHCIHLDDHEKRMIRESGVWVAENIESNQNNNVGVTGYLDITDNVMLGTDGMHSDMLRSAKAAFLAGQGTEGIDLAGIYERFRKIHVYLLEHGFSGDEENNLVILDYDAPTPVNQDNFLGHLVYGIDASHVQSVISSGRLIVENRRLLTEDEAEILRFSREMGNKLWHKMRP
jgi:cytosine/adenosine deaminase-related metal-dependent hydrolase